MRRATIRDPSQIPRRGLNAVRVTRRPRTRTIGPRSTIAPPDPRSDVPRDRSDRSKRERAMSRRRTKRLLPAALPVAAVLLGAGLTAARKLRAARRARHQFRDPVAAPSQALEPLTPTPVDSAPSPSDSPSVEPLPAPTEPAAARRARGATTANVLEVLAKGGTMTAAEVALATGISRATISSTLSRLARTGEVTKAGRGCRTLVRRSQRGRPPPLQTGTPARTRRRVRCPEPPRPRCWRLFPPMEV